MNPSNTTNKPAAQAATKTLPNATPPIEKNQNSTQIAIAVIPNM